MHLEFVITVALLAFTGSAVRMPAVLKPRGLTETPAKEESFLPLGQTSSQTIKMDIDPITREIRVAKVDIKIPVVPPVEHVYTLDISDLQRVDDYIKNLRAHIQARVFGHLETADTANRLDKAYLLYDNLKIIRANYAREKDKIEEKVEYLKKITEYALSYAQNATTADLSRVIVEKGVDIDAYNKFILLQLLEKLDQKMGDVHRGVLTDLPNIFDEFDHINSHPTASGYQVVNKNIELSFRLTVFDANVLGATIDSVLAISRKIVDNENYHHIASRSAQKITFGAAVWHAALAIWVLAMTL